MPQSNTKKQPCDVSVITVTWNSAKTIGDQIRSVFVPPPVVSCEELVVDNASTDETLQAIHNTALPVTVIQQGKNAGFAAGNNAALHQASGRYLLFLNPDMKLLPGTIDTLVSYLDHHPKAVIASAELLDQTGTLLDITRPKRFPRRMDLLLLVTKLQRCFPRLMDSYLMRDVDLSRAQAVETVRGSCMLVRQSFVNECGFAFDPRYFIWFEDVDLCREAITRGFEVHYVPEAKASDLVGRSFMQQNFFWKQRQFSRSMIIYERKWGHPIFAFFLYILWIPFLLLAWIFTACNVRLRASRI